MTENRLFYNVPPSKMKLKKTYYVGFKNLWEQTSLPLGNGTMGLTVQGEVKSDKLVFNQKTLWTGGPSKNYPNYCGGNIIDKDNKGKTRYDYFNEIRELFKNGNNNEASKMCDKLIGLKDGFGAYQCWGNFEFEFKDIKKYSNYIRELDMENGICSVSYDAKLYNDTNVKDRREYFVSYPDKCCVIHFERTNGTLNVNMGLYTDHKGKLEFNNDGTFYHKGELEDNFLKFCLCGKIITDGNISKDKESVNISDAKSILIVFSADTDYMDNYPKYRTGESSDALYNRVLMTIELIKHNSYNDIKKRHMNDFSGLFNRVKFDLGGKNIEPTNKLVKNYDGFFHHSDKRCAEQLLYQLGRYFTISSSREDDILPSNLQGIWNCTNTPIWNSDYHLNINLQMNYWPTLNGNLSECEKPLIRYIKSLVIPGRVTAEVYTGIKSTENKHNGFLFHTQNSPFGWTCPGWQFDWGWSPAAVPWILHNIFEYYEYTLDDEILKYDIYPLLCETADYFKRLLIKTDKRYLTVPCFSPEHGPRTMGNTYEQAILYQLYSDAISAAKALNIDNEKQKEWQDIKDNLHPYELGNDGQIKEWYNETKLGSIGQKHHRHMSHLLGLFPCNVINWHDNPELIKGAIISMNHRTDKSTGWSMGQKINTWARVGDGNRVLKIIGDLIKSGVYSNLWDYHPPFQIDGNFGYTSGVNEMLMQSHCGFIHLLPALPTDWKNGKIKGIVARGNFTVNMEWENNKLVTASVISNKGGELKVYYDKEEFSINGVESINNMVKINTEQGKTYELKF